MATMTLAVPEDLKKEMDKFSIINWSAVAREAFAERIKKLRLLESITMDSRLSEADVEKLGRKLKQRIATAHEKKA